MRINQFFEDEDLPAPQAKEQSTPRISVNKLAEYIEASVVRRRAIVSTAKNPLKFHTTRYATARELMAEYIVSRNIDALNDGISRITNSVQDTDFKRNDALNSVEVLELLKEVDLSDLNGLSISQWNGGNPLLNINGVNVSVNPDLFIEGTVRKKQVIGLAKLSIIKTNPLSASGQSIVALLVKDFLTSVRADQSGLVSNKLCLSFDVFQQRIVSCPTAEKQRRTEVEAACSEIANWWDTL